MMHLDNDSREKISGILKSADWSFSHLVEISGLNPKIDFRFGDFSNLDLRGQNLTGFDFTGSDLRGCLIDKYTIIDGTTILQNSDTDWLHQDRIPIHEKMFEVSAARNTIDRRAALDELVSQYTSPTHTRLYLRRLIEKTSSADEFFDILDYFTPENSDDKSAISDTLIKILLKGARRKNRNSVEVFSASSFSSFISRIAVSNNPYIQERYTAFLNNSVTRGKISLNPNKYEVSEDLKNLISAFENSPIAQVDI